jgi:hypothetical protein
LLEKRLRPISIDPFLANDGPHGLRGHLKYLRDRAEATARLVRKQNLSAHSLLGATMGSNRLLKCSKTIVLHLSTSWHMSVF